jgi:hypothetical protein
MDAGPGTELGGLGWFAVVWVTMNAIGDGKVFVVPVEEAYRIRTGESGEKTLQAHPGISEAERVA